MSRALRFISFVAILLIVGCGKNAEIKADLNQLENAFPTAGALPAAAPLANSGSANAGQLVHQAVAAARANDYPSSVAALQAAQTAQGVNADQVMAIQKTMKSITLELADRASRGDEKAKADLAAIERSRSQ